MRLAAATIVASLAWTACSLAGPDRPLPVETLALGQRFTLRAGQSAQSADGRLQVGVVGVTSDSRCPKGERCVWAGDATVQVWLRQASGPKETRELHTAPGPAQTARAFGHELCLVQLDPYPVSGKTLAQQDYVATLTLSATRGCSSPEIRGARVS